MELYLETMVLMIKKFMLLKLLKQNLIQVLDLVVFQTRIEKQQKKFITENSGKADAFKANNIAYANSIEIESSTDTRQGMVDIVNQDNGKGGTSDANNREYEEELREMVGSRRNTRESCSSRR